MSETLLSETVSDLANWGATPADVLYVGTINGEWQIEWDAFAAIADVEYDAGFGSAKVAGDLAVVLRDGRYLTRREYDGSESWEMNMVPAPRNADARTFGMVVDPKGYWPSLEELNEVSAEN